METIKSWIQESDYAGELGKPRFALVITDEALRQKSFDFVGMENYQKFLEFKQSVVETISTFCIEDERHINVVIHEKLLGRECKFAEREC